MDALWVHHFELFSDVGFRWQGEHQVFERGVQGRVAQHGAQGLNQGSIQHLCRCVAGGDCAESCIQAQALRCFPLVEWVGVVRQECEQLRGREVFLQHHRGAEAAQDGGHRLFARLQGQVFEFKALLAFSEHQQLAGQHLAAIGTQQAKLHGNDKRFFVLLAGAGWAALAQRERVGACVGVVAASGLHTRRACLCVPTLELRQVCGEGRARVGIGNGLCEVVASHSSAIVALEVERHAFGKAFTT